MARDLQKGRRDPNHKDQANPHQQQCVVFDRRIPEEQNRAEGFDQHRGTDHQGRSPLESFLVRDEIFFADQVKERVMDNLDVPDESKHKPSRKRVEQQQGK